jgi:hypothetical protein
MSRSPLFLPMNRGLDMEGGGAADLQTDVMRFMAIISLCLVAIFAIVQSIPLGPVVSQELPPVSLDDNSPVAATNVQNPQQASPKLEMVLVRPEPTRIPQREEPVVLQRPIVKPVKRVPAKPSRPLPTPVASTPRTTSEPSAPSEPQVGFTLRFESDHALTRLVARNEVGFFAITPDRSLRLNIESGRMGFWSASTPKQIHEMEQATVPQAVLDAYARSSGSRSSAVKWGVSIPPAMSSQLNRFLSEHEGGFLIIGASGELRLEQ